MSSQDQAAGLRKWADLQRQQQQADTLTDVAAAEHVSEPAPPLSTPTAPAAPDIPVAPRPRLPLVVVGLSGSRAQQVSKVKARLGQWASLGRHWAGDPDDWDIHVVMAEAPDLAKFRDEYSRWALWVNSDAGAFADMYRTLRILHEQGGPRRLLALHEPHLPRQGLLDNLREAADYYLKMELLVLAR